MRRRVIQLAEKTSVVSLPSKWVKKYGIKKGNELEVLERGNDLIIKTGLGNTQSNVTVDILNFSEMSLRYLTSALHKAGYDKITLFNCNQNHLTVIQDLINNLLTGFVVIERGQKRVVLKSIATDIEIEFDSALRRAFLVTISLSESSFEMIKSGNFSNLKSLLSLERANDQLTSFCLRLMAKGMYKDEKTITFMATIIWTLEKIGDEYKYICFNLASNNKKIGQDAMVIYEKVNTFFKLYYELFYNFNIQKLNELSDKRFEILRLLNETNINSRIENQLAKHLHSIMSKTVDMSSSILGLRHANLQELKQEHL